GTVEYARMLCLVLDPARLARDGATSPVPATPALWEALGQQRPVSLAAVPELTLPEAVGEIRVVGLPASLLTLAGTPRTIEGLSPGAALDALRAALAEHPPERRMQVSFAVNVVPEDPLPHRISVIFPPLPLLPAGPATAPDPGDPEPPTETPLETSRPTTRVRWLQRLTDRRRL
ncbi:MAG: hypothetical protein K0Q72_4424, partial [Armatimonadetes bacterium]|nr:hypothetical protein [Armatimonadota bacterium]